VRNRERHEAPDSLAQRENKLRKKNPTQEKGGVQGNAQPIKQEKKPRKGRGRVPSKDVKPRPKDATNRKDTEEKEEGGDWAGKEVSLSYSTSPKRRKGGGFSWVGAERDSLKGDKAARSRAGGGERRHRRRGAWGTPQAQAATWSERRG